MELRGKGMVGSLSEFLDKVNEALGGCTSALIKVRLDNTPAHTSYNREIKTSFHIVYSYAAMDKFSFRDPKMIPATDSDDTISLFERDRASFIQRLAALSNISLFETPKIENGKFEVNVSLVKK